MQRETERDLIAAWRRGNLPAAQEFVRARQPEARSIAYLLAGDRERTLGLTETAFLALFDELSSLDPETDLRARLIIHLGRCFVRQKYEVTSSDRSEAIADSAQHKFRVESQRERTLTALDRLNDRERATLLLTDMSGIDPDEMNALNRRGDDPLSVPVDTARERLRESLNVHEDESLRPILVEAGFDGPTDDLWPRLEAPLTALRRREKRRGQLLTLSVLGTVVLMAAVTVAAIFGPELVNGGSADAAAPATPPVMEKDFVIVGSARPDPTPTPTPALPPAGEVPGTLLARTYHDQNSEHPYSTLSAYDLSRNELQPIFRDGFGSNTGWVQISPDGRQVVGIREERTATTRQFALVAFDSRTFERQWDADIGTFERGDEQDDPGPQLVTAITSDRVYVAVVSQRMPYEASIRAFDLHDGSRKESGTIDLESDRMVTGFRGTVSLFVPPDESRLLLGAEGYAADGRPSQTLIFEAELPTLAQSRELVRSDFESSAAFWLGNANVTPDGESLYAVTSTSNNAEAQVSFLNLNGAEMTVLPLPFVKSDDEPYLATTTVLSHDGRKLYVFHQSSGDVAIIDLVEQRIERTFPIDTGEFGTLFGLGPKQLVFAWANHLSADGTHLYVAAGPANRNQRGVPTEDFGIWVIILNEWRIVDFWPTAGQVGEFFPIPSEDALLITQWAYEDDRSIQNLTKVSLADGRTLQESVNVPTTEEGYSPTLSSLIAIYRDQFGRSPTVDGIEPSTPTEIATLPRIEAMATSNIVAAGVAATVEVHILDPASGEILDSPNPHVRFDDSSGIMAILRADGQPAQIVVLAGIEAGIFRGGVVLPVVGEWSIDVVVVERDGTMSLSHDAGQINVAPTFVGSDDRLYQFQVSADPEQPRLDETISIQLRLIDIETGAPLPDGVSLATDQPALEDGTVESMPERIDVAFSVGTGTYDGYRTALLYRVSDGVYEGETSLWQPGTWSAQIRFQPPGHRRINIPAGTIEVEG